ncbi:hypothetical protein TRFO_25125 [Tritrichomonas foetus]|uniref:Uncharacterized protein n=1 Tax=Tritrichomonas foetus TaxID=1144522 RepID=A0A1J4K7F5_9EUKA|nr:hypothetical protein TRFO_25125 [Tritrichomonas foetus]|eukprot:OHT06816.1 hypothetical protein TRFO_25125 [Tritrichomonas foetus]
MGRRKLGHPRVHRIIVLDSNFDKAIEIHELDEIGRLKKKIFNGKKAKRNDGNQLENSPFVHPQQNINSMNSQFDNQHLNDDQQINQNQIQYQQSQKQNFHPFPNPLLHYSNNYSNNQFNSNFQQSNTSNQMSKYHAPVNPILGSKINEEEEEFCENNKNEKNVQLSNFSFGRINDAQNGISNENQNIKNNFPQVVLNSSPYSAAAVAENRERTSIPFPIVSKPINEGEFLGENQKGSEMAFLFGNSNENNMNTKNSNIVRNAYSALYFKNNIFQNLSNMNKKFYLAFQKYRFAKFEVFNDPPLQTVPFFIEVTDN